MCRNRFDDFHQVLRSVDSGRRLRFVDSDQIPDDSGTLHGYDHNRHGCSFAHCIRHFGRTGFVGPGHEVVGHRQLVDRILRPENERFTSQSLSFTSW